MECSTRPKIKRGKFASGLPDRDILQEVTNNNVDPDSIKAHLPDRIRNVTSQDDLKLKLLSVLEGRFESPGFSDTKSFRHAAHRQQLVMQSNANSTIWGTLSAENQNYDYALSVADWDTLSGSLFHVRWWSKGFGNFCNWDRGLKFWTYEELQEAHREQRLDTSGPCHDQWCIQSGKVCWDMFWSVALLLKYSGSSGVKQWDDQFKSLLKMNEE